MHHIIIEDNLWCPERRTEKSLEIDPDQPAAKALEERAKKRSKKES